MKNGKRICHITTVHSRFDARIFHRECKSLTDAGYMVCLIAPGSEEEFIEGVHIIPVQNAKNRLYRFFVTDFTALVKAGKLNCDLYHFHDPELIWVGVALKILRKKVIYDVHENVSLQISSKFWIPVRLRMIVAAIFRLIEGFSVRFFDKIIVAGQDILQQSHLKRFERKVSVVNNFPIETIRDDNLSRKKFITAKFIYSGNINEERGILEIIKAANLIIEQDFELTIMGNFENNKVRNKVLFEAKDNRKISIYPAVPYEELFNTLLEYNVGMICFKPTPNNLGAIYGRNNKIFEYLQAGLAIIASDLPGWKDFVCDNEVGVVANPNDPASIAEAMRYLILNKNILKRMSKNSRNLSLKYSWKSQSEALIKAYREVLS